MTSIVIENRPDGEFHVGAIAIHDGKITGGLSDYALRIFVLAGNMAG